VAARQNLILATRAQILPGGKPQKKVQKNGPPKKSAFNGQDLQRGPLARSVLRASERKWR